MRIHAVHRSQALRIGLTLLSLLSIVTGIVLVGAAPRGADASMQNVLRNGSFEGGFYSAPGCGMVGQGWTCFTNGGLANYGFYDDEWEPVVADGEHSQLIEINTKGLVAPDADRYAGIYQTVKVEPWTKYKLDLRGMIRTTNFDGDEWRYQVQVGWTNGGHADWQMVENWQDVGWYNYYERTKPGSLSGYTAVITARDEQMTLYVRVWKKWGVPNEEIDVNLDAIALTGLMPEMKPMPMGEGPMNGDQMMGKPDGEMMGGPEGQAQWRPPSKPMGEPPMKPMAEPAMVCGGENLVYNGGFEYGFNPATIGDVGRGWGSFTNGGAAAYGFYDEQWDPVVAEGEHGQLIEINTKGFMPADGNRYAGIYQRIGHLEPGKTYELVVRGMLRGDGGEAGDPNRFEAQVGYLWGGDTNWEHVSNWTGMDLGKIYPRTQPGSIGTYRVRFQADATSMVLFLRGWLKWGETNLEFDLNYDAIRLVGCDEPMTGWDKPMSGPPMDGPGMDGPGMGWTKPMPPEGGMGEKPGGGDCVYVVKPGDTLSGIAAKLGVSLPALLQSGSIANPDLIYVGQKIVLPNCGMDEMMPMPKGEPMQPEQDAPMAKPEGKPDGRDEMGPPANKDESDGKEQMMQPESGSSPWRMARQSSQVHTVRAGETLSQIAAQYGLDPSELARLNGISNANFIYIGQEILLPTMSET